MVLDFSIITVANAAIGRERLGVVADSDERLSDARQPLPHQHGALAELDQVSTAALQDGSVTTDKLASLIPQSLLGNPLGTSAGPRAITVSSPLAFVNGELTVSSVAPDFNALLTDGASVLVGAGSVLWGVA